MKKIFMAAVAFAAAVTVSMGLSSCSSSDDSSNGGGSNSDANEEAMQAINEDYVNNVVIPTYKNLAECCTELNKYIGYIEEYKNDASVSAAGTQWKKARQWWEWSEAFLFGAASGYSIDPHIDTWPLDQAALTALLKSLPEDVAGYVANLNNGLVGFHGIEYILFRNGNPRSYDDIMSENGGKELEYAKAVAYDLMVSSYRLEAAWAGIDNIPAAHKTVLEEEELEPEDNFGEEFVNAGEAGSRYKTVKLATLQIIAGCNDILGEVAESKIGKPCLGSSEEDINYIESPHAYNSIQDFTDNTLGCQYALYGKNGATSAQENSIMAYAKKNHPTEAAKVETAMAEAVAAVKAMRSPFVTYRTDDSAKNAIDKLDAFVDALNDLSEAIRKND